MEGELRVFIVAGEVKLKETVEAAFHFRPHVVVTVDSKGFSFRLLKQLRARYDQDRADGPIHFHYVAPSFWAWKGGEARLKGLSKFVDHLFCILQNEEAVCRSNGLAATFVGHPILEDVLELNMASRVALCTSGTVAMELQLARLPCLVTYRAHFLTEWFIRFKSKIPYISLPNILLDSPVIPEAPFQTCTPAKVAFLLKELMNNVELQQQQILAAEKVMELIRPSIRTVDYSEQQGMNRTPPTYSPSMIAASTILGYNQR
ncbi:putative lipid-A-disaccharide synthase [Hibiscus syriacus]|uniref:lipid-A-disaccharide synthase n=1 Tax=Hibiscus syriacus TaxID=106335 RepID=A0A6A3CM74_HIBSY|nr:putative lipid-A-disaccharide synthase [Hibiscus syriacus]